MEPALLHATVALPSFHQAFMDSGSESAIEPAVDEFGLNQYNKAHVSLTKYTSTTGENSVLVVLTCCILFISFDMLRGDFESAGKHILSGLKILSNVGARHSNVLQDDLEPRFVRLSIQTKSVFDAPSPLDDPVARIVSFPVVFSSLTEARNSLNGLMNQVFSFVLVETSRVEIYGQEMRHHEAESTLTERTSYISLLEQWKIVFDGFHSYSRTEMSSNDLDGASLLKIHYAATQVMIFSAPNFLQCIHDLFLSQYERIVALAKCLIKKSNRMSSAGGLLWVETAIIPPLFLTAWKCRDPWIRREAVRLLLSPRKEGAWDSIAAASLEERIIAVEETGLPNVMVGQDVPESSRVYAIKIKSIQLHPRFSRRCIFDFFKDASNLGSTTGITETVTW